MERRPIRTKLQNRVVTTAAIAVNAVGPDEVSFGTTVITSDPVNTIENPKDGLFVVNQTAGTTSVYSEEQGSYVALPAVDGTARSDAGDAIDAADAAQATADGKNKIFRQNNAPTTAESSAGDLWYDQDDGNKMYRYVGSPTNAWAQAVVLGTNAVANLNASVITAGTIDANVISVVNLNAANIATGNLSAARIATTALNANNITAGTITGISIQTSNTGNRIAMTNTDELQFFATDGNRIGTIGPLDYSPTSQEGLVLTSGLPNAEKTASVGLQSDATGSYAHITANGFLSPSVILTYTDNGVNQRININGGGQSATDGSVDILAGQGGITIRSWTGDSAGADEISFVNEYSNSGSIGILSDRIRLYGALVVGAQTVVQGTGAPSNYTGNEARANIGAIFFKYT
jgi:F0F1-type ATP synthase epsilon subunit